jgi:hypothetical protein
MTKIVITILVLIRISSTFAGDIFLQGRLFMANTYLNKIGNLNTFLENEGLKKVDKTSNFGVEITFPTFRFFEPGMRYTRRTFNSDEDPSNTQTDYEANGSQDSVLLLGRIPFIRSSFFRFDIFAGVGGSNTTIKVKSATSNGELSRTGSADWFATPYYAFGSSVGFGIKSILVYAEAGYESNKVTNLKESGTMSSGISSVDFSGRYFMIGLMFDGIKGYKK